MFYNNYKQSACSVTSDSATLRTIGRQDPLSMGFSRQEYWSGLPFPPSGDRPNPRMELASPTSNALKGLLYPLSYWERSHKRSMLLPLSRFSRVRLCVTPEMAAHQAPPSLGFSRQKHWIGLPFPSPMHESEVAQSCPTLCDPPGLQPTRLPRPWDSPGKNTGVGCHFLLQGVKVKSLSHVRLFTTPWTAAHQAPPSMGFSRQEYWSGLPLDGN